MREGFHFGNVYVTIDIHTLALFREDDRHVKAFRRHTCNTDAGGFNRQNFVDGLICKTSLELFAHLAKQAHIHLVV